MSYLYLAMLILQSVVGLCDAPPGSDLSGNGEVTAYDAHLALQRYAVDIFRRSSRFDI